MKACPDCGATLVLHCSDEHGNRTSRNCDLLRCPRCESYGSVRHWATKTKENDKVTWSTRPLAGILREAEG